MKKTILMVFFTSILLGGYNQHQIDNLNIAYNKGLELKKRTGISYECTLTAIMLTESSAGKNIIGDQYRGTQGELSLYKSSLGSMQIQIGTVRYLMSKSKYLRKKYHYLYQQNFYPIYSELTKKLNNSTTLKNKLFYIKKLKKYRNAIKKDQLLINKLLTDNEFSVEIAFGYLVLNYNRAKRNNMWNPYYKSISKYNGGWYNKLYYNRVMKNMKEVKRLIRKGIIYKYK